MTDPAQNPAANSPADRPVDETNAGRRDKTAEKSGKKKLGPDLSGTTLGDFELLRRVGAGGMGEVYLAHQLALKRRVAVKVLRGELTGDATHLRRFAVEAEAAGKLAHANIVQIYALGEQNGTRFMALEFVEGMTLGDYVRKKGPLPARRAVRVLEQVALALEHAGAAGIVHRDIKPDNILLTRKGEVKVTDFGLARLRADSTLNLTDTGVTMGTPLYMSPEQVEGQPLDMRSDLYSFGATAYYMLTGQPPFEGPSALAVAVKHMQAQPKALETLREDLPPELCRIVRKLMAKKPDERYPTAREARKDLEKLHAELRLRADAAAEPSEPPSPPATEPAATPRAGVRRAAFLARVPRNLRVWFAASIPLALAGGAAFGWYRRAPDLRPAAVPAGVAPAAVPWEQVRELETARAQYNYALAVAQFLHDPGPEAAWTAVINRFPTEIDWVWRAQMQLGRHYMEERQFGKAEALFAEMSRSADRKMQLAGEVGRATVLSMRDQPQESLQVLWDLAQTGEVSSDRMLLGMMLSTFERDYRNLGQDWNAESRKWASQRLEQWRQQAR